MFDVDDDFIGVRPAQIIPTNFETLSRVIIPGTTPGNKTPFCPVRPKGCWPHTNEQIKEWVREVIVIGKTTGFLYMPEAICYFATHCFWPPYRNGKICPHHTRVHNLIWESAEEEYTSGVGVCNHFVDDAPENI